MRFDRRLSFLLVSIPIGCASVQSVSDDESDDATASGGKTGAGGARSGGASSTGGRASGGAPHSGGASGSGGARSGGASSAGGSESTGGRASSGGTTSGGGAPPTGGSASSGGSATGGGWTGDCEDKPTMAAWRSGSGQMTGDLVIHKCTKKQSECQDLEVGVESLFECVSSHTNNCITQLPEDGSAWEFRGECADLVPMGGASGMAGSTG